MAAMQNCIQRLVHYIFCLFSAPACTNMSFVHQLSTMPSRAMRRFNVRSSPVSGLDISSAARFDLGPLPVKLSERPAPPMLLPHAVLSLVGNPVSPPARHGARDGHHGKADAKPPFDKHALPNVFLAWAFMRH